MPSYSKNDIILVRYPFSNLSNSKVRPAVVVSAPHVSQDIMITPLTSKTGSLLEGEFELSEWAAVGLNVVTAVKRGLYTVHESLVVKVIGQLADSDAKKLEQSLRAWLVVMKHASRPILRCIGGLLVRASVVWQR